MSFGMIRLSIFSGIFILIAGCGGSGGSTGGSGGGGNPTTVTVTFAGATPTAVATQIGSGAYTTATPANTVTLTLPSGTTNFAVAYVCPPINEGTTANPQMETYESVLEASSLDGSSFSESCPTAPTTGPTGTTGTLTGTTDGSAIPGASELLIVANNGTSGASTSAGVSSASFSMTAPAGTDRVAVTASEMTLQGFEEYISLLAVKNFSSQTVPGALNGGNTVVLGAADQTVQETITYQNVPAGFGAPSTNVFYLWNGGGGLFVANAVTSSYPALPSGATESGDYYSFVATAYSNTTDSMVAVTTNTTSGGSQSFTFPQPWSYSGPTPAARPSFDLIYSGSSGASNFIDGISIIWIPTLTSESVVNVSATSKYLNGSTTIAVPDLSSLTGFIAPPPSGAYVIWSAEILQANFSLLQATPSTGTITEVYNGGTFNVP